MSYTGYRLTFGQARLDDILSVSIDRSVSVDNTNLRSGPNQTIVTIKGQTYQEYDAAQVDSDGDQLQPLIGAYAFGGTLPDDNYSNLSLSLIVENGSEIFLFENESARWDSSETTNSTEVNHIQVLDYSMQFTIFEEDNVFHNIKNVSSINLSYSSSTASDSFAYGGGTPTTNYPEPTYTDSTAATQRDSSEGPSYTLTRTISAVGIKTKDNSSTSHASTAVSRIKSLDDANITNRLPLGSSRPFDLSTKTTTDYGQGSETLVETYVFYTKSANKKYRDNFSIDISSDNRSADTYTTATVNGTILGLNTKSFNSRSSDPFDNNRFTNATHGWSQVAPLIFDRITANMASVNPIPLSKQVTYDDNKGTIDYSFTYDTRPISLVSGAITEDIIVSDQNTGRAVKLYPIAGGDGYRTAKQDLGTYTLPSRTVTYTAQFPKGYSTGGVQSMIDNVIDQFDPQELNPVGGSFMRSQVESDTSSSDAISNKITQTKKWVYYIKG